MIKNSSTPTSQVDNTPKYPMPDIHFNGTDPVALAEGYINIHKAIRELEETINKSPFHSRDYYTLNWESQGSYTAFTAAQEERAKHLINLGEFKKYTEDHIMHIRHYEV
jgi:hypothetical protein